jgi:hypothetical protein
MIQAFLQKFLRLRSIPIPLGRWCRTDKVLNDVKVDLANVDHCGTCVHEKVKDTPSIPKHIELPRNQMK